jgi:hypothetical protein
MGLHSFTCHKHQPALPPAERPLCRVFGVGASTGLGFRDERVRELPLASPELTSIPLERGERPAAEAQCLSLCNERLDTGSKNVRGKLGTSSRLPLGGAVEEDDFTLSVLVRGVPHSQQPLCLESRQFRLFDVVRDDLEHVYGDRLHSPAAGPKERGQLIGTVRAANSHNLSQPYCRAKARRCATRARRNLKLVQLKEGTASPGGRTLRAPVCR